MKEQEEYFIIPQLQTIQANCSKFISASQAKWRNIQRYQQPPFQRVAKYTRNIEYCSQNVRTFQTLKKVLSYLIKTIFPLLLQQNVKPNERYSISIFLQQRLKAIRCELFVQGIICPSMILQLIHANIIIEMMKEKNQINNQLIGLQHLIDPNHQQIMKRDYPKEYQSALIIAILSINKQQIQNLLLKHQIILEHQKLYSTLVLRLKIQRNNYDAFYNSLEHSQPIIKCLLWRRIEKFKQNLIQILRKSFGDIPISWLNKRLGFQQPEKQGWISLKQMKQPLKGTNKGFLVWISMHNLKSLLC